MISFAAERLWDLNQIYNNFFSPLNDEDESCSLKNSQSSPRGAELPMDTNLCPSYSSSSVEHSTLTLSRHLRADEN